MYLLTISVDLCPVIAMILLSSAPDSAVDLLQNLILNYDPNNFYASIPA